MSKWDEYDRHYNLALTMRRLNIFKTNDEMAAVMGVTAQIRWDAQKRLGWSLWRRIKHWLQNA